MEACSSGRRTWWLRFAITLLITSYAKTFLSNPRLSEKIVE